MDEGRKSRDSLVNAFHSLFFAMSRLTSMPWRCLEEMLQTSPDASVLQDVLQKTVLHPLCKKYPPSVKYRRVFLTALIKKHEATTAEPLDELYEALADVLSAEESVLCYKSYFLPLGDSITLCESVAIISEGTTGLVTWEAALCLAEWIMGNPDLFTNRTVLELGSGVGLTGLVLCKTCSPRRYVFSDYHPAVLQGLRKNILLNGFLLDSGPVDQPNLEFPKAACVQAEGPSVVVMGLDWAAVTDDKLSQFQADVVIAADVVYDPEIILCLVGIFHRLLTCKRGGITPDIYVASTVRNPETYQQFKAQLDYAGIGQQTIPHPDKVVFPYDRASNIEILKLGLKETLEVQCDFI